MLQSVAGRIPRPIGRRYCLLLSVALFTIAWAAAVLMADISFILLDPKTRTGFEVLLSVVSLFAALVLVMLPDETMREPLRWVALGFVLLGFGSLGFGYLYPVLDEPLSLNEGMYGSLFVRTATAACLAVGLAIAHPLQLTRKGFAGVVAAAVVAGALVILLADELPRLTSLDSLAGIANNDKGPIPGLTTLHWVLSIVPIALATIAAIGAIRRYSHAGMGRWLGLAMVLFAGSQLHSAFWPSGFLPVFTTSSVLRLAFTIVITAGVILELRNIATERTFLLAQERDYSRRLEDLAVLRADFTAMVVHELASPLAGIRRSAELLGDNSLSAMQQRAVENIRNEAAMLVSLVDDVQVSARAERDDFSLQSGSVPVSAILEIAHSFDDERVEVNNAVVGRVVADPERIGQVLRNLLSNALKFSPPESTVQLNTSIAPGGCIRFEVADHGPGIDPRDIERIFEKFGRGRLTGDGGQMFAPGVGLGLYLSRRIVRASGSELQVLSDPTTGTVFWFDLESAS